MNCIQNNSSELASGNEFRCGKKTKKLIWVHAKKDLVKGRRRKTIKRTTNKSIENGFVCVFMCVCVFVLPC